MILAGVCPVSHEAEKLDCLSVALTRALADQLCDVPPVLGELRYPSLGRLLSLFRQPTIVVGECVHAQGDELGCDP